mmetsp:Transcript_2776/g.6571  ORF Transcript_2776/g.6571 Transcript_2776/m.6571 type:complete len:221 (+) Transcript_2776:2467-3129(+)
MTIRTSADGLRTLARRGRNHQRTPAKPPRKPGYCQTSYACTRGRCAWLRRWTDTKAKAMVLPAMGRRPAQLLPSQVRHLPTQRQCPSNDACPSRDSTGLTEASQVTSMAVVSLDASRSSHHPTGFREASADVLPVHRACLCVGVWWVLKILRSGAQGLRRIASCEDAPEVSEQCPRPSTSEWGQQHCCSEASCGQMRARRPPPGIRRWHWHWRRGSLHAD